MTARLVLDANIGDFNASWGANRFAVRSNDGTWFTAMQDGVFGRVLWHTSTGIREIKLDPVPSMRPTLYADPSGLYCIGGFDGDKKHILIWYIDDYKTVFAAGVTNDPRVDALISQFAALTQRITAIETALGNISQEAPTFDPKDREILNRYRRLHGLD
jgi:hypothetical protein